MDIKLIEKIIESASKYGTLKEIIPSTMGEPLFYKDFDKIIVLCHKYHVKLNLTTNGTFPGKRSVTEWAKKIVPVASDVKKSFNGATAETAEAVMKGVDYTKILQNI